MPPRVFLLVPPACCSTGVNAGVAAAALIIFYEGEWGEVKSCLLSAGQSFAAVRAPGRSFLGRWASCRSRGELPGPCGIHHQGNTWPGFSRNGWLVLCGRRSDLPRRAEMNCFASQEAQKPGEPNSSPAVPVVSATPGRGGSAPWKRRSQEGFNGEPSFGSGWQVLLGCPAFGEDALSREGVLKLCLRHAPPQIKVQQLWGVIRY